MLMFVSEYIHSMAGFIYFECKLKALCFCLTILTAKSIIEIFRQALILCSCW